MPAWPDWWSRRSHLVLGFASCLHELQRRLCGGGAKACYDVQELLARWEEAGVDFPSGMSADDADTPIGASYGGGGGGGEDGERESGRPLRSAVLEDGAATTLLVTPPGQPRTAESATSVVRRRCAYRRASVDHSAVCYGDSSGGAGVPGRCGAAI